MLPECCRKREREVMKMHSEIEALHKEVAKLYPKEGVWLSDYEKPKAEAILNQLEGMSIASAMDLLEKCRSVLMLCKVQKIHAKNSHSPGGLSFSNNDTNAE